jgi:UDP-N-acetylmuramoyl-L-alanyl-D-glutamate--2,6-diaminopimelate ligase
VSQPERHIHLTEVLDGLTVVAGGAADVCVSAITEDSRQVRPGTLFVAVRGTREDGRRYVSDAIGRGAAAVVVVGSADDVTASVPAVAVAEGREAVGVMAARVYGAPSERLKLAGVTGTNGKTTTTFLLAEAARAAGLVPGIIGTTGHYIDRTMRPALTTTPSACELHALLAEMVAAGAGWCAAEVSSHAVTQRREAGARFAALCFTNLTRDHLDYHGTMEAYYAAKRELFVLHREATAVVNVDGDQGARLARELGDAGVVTVACEAGARAAVRVIEAQLDASGIRARVATPWGAATIDSPLVGAYNLANIVGALATAAAAGLPLDAAARGVSRLRAVPGRLERVAAPADAPGPHPDVFVDYAHTPDALERVLTAVRPQTAGRLFAVFGCGGDRDRTKRPLMGEAAARLADVAVVTSDNPRTEDPRAIIDEILPGVRASGKPEVRGAAAASGFFVEADRRAAIAWAVAAARPGDAVVIAGKGHEDYQIIGAQKRPFDDRVEAARALGRAAGVRGGAS